MKFLRDVYVAMCGTMLAITICIEIIKHAHT
jgi:hypothetical protein